MREIILTNQMTSIVDDEDYEKLVHYKWHYHYNGYARRNIKIGGKWTGRYMHNLIVNSPDNMDIDHINHNKLDNRKINLRICTRSENNRNQIKRKGLSSSFMGVSWHKHKRKWRVQLQVNKKRISGGYYDDENVAGVAFNKLAEKHYGKFALLNDVQACETVLKQKEGK